ncbi:MAG TPA: hypothetical protein VIT38_08045 [Allosphingosinicella sp.]|jgi:hypothetical protein
MRSRRKTRLRYVGAALSAFFLVVILMSVLPDLGAEANSGLPPTALNQIARRNDLAAAEAAANLRARSEASARAADSMRDARDHAREGGETGAAASPPAR